MMETGKQHQLELTFMGHGGYLEIVCRDGRECKYESSHLNDGTIMAEEIQRIFSTSCCRGLTVKPNHLYVAACTGRVGRKPSVVGFAAQRDGQRSHFFTFYSSTQENGELYDYKKGICFEQALVSVFSTDYKTDHIVSIANKIFMEFPKFIHSGYVQIPRYGSKIGLKRIQYNERDLPKSVANLSGQQLPPGFSHSSDVRVLNPSDSRQLYDASRYGDLKKVKRLITHGSPDINSKHYAAGWTALIRACVQGFAAIAEVLLSNNADIKIEEKDGNTALTLAAKWGRTSCVAVLLMHNPSIVHHKNQNGETALSFARRRGLNDIISLLEQAGAKY